MTAISWKSGISGSWTTAADWSTNLVPGALDDVTIGVGGGYTVSITALPVSIRSLTISDPSAILAIDTSGAGGSRVALTGSLSNSGHIEIGNASLSQATTVSVVGFSNTGEIDLTGSAAVQAALLVEPGAPATLTGKFFLAGDALLAFESGGVTAIGNSAELSLTGAKARVALGSAELSNSALTQLGSNVGTLRLESGVKVNTTVDFLNNGVVDVDDSASVGGSRLTIGGTLTNRGNIVLGNSLLPTATFLTAANLVNAGSITLTGSGAIQATLNVLAAAPSTFTGINNLTGDALLEYASGAINNIVIGSTLSLTGPHARVALASKTSSNSALTALAGNAGTFNLENGAAVAITGGFTNTGLTEIDTAGGAGNSLLTIGGTLTNSAIIAPNGLKIGNATLSVATLVRAAAFSNTGETDITGAGAVQATLNIAGPAPTTVTGVLKLTNDALLQYGSGTFTGIGSGSTLSLNGVASRVADAALPNSNSALTTLASNLGTLRLDGGAIVTTNVGVNFANSGLVQVDDAGGGGSRLAIGGTLSNNVAGGNGIKIGNSSLSAATLVTAAGLSNTGEIDLTGAASVSATLQIAGAAPSTLTGTNNLTNDAPLQYGSGAITAIGSGAKLNLNGGLARVALASATGSNSALRTLASNAGTLGLQNGAVLGTTVGLNNAGTLDLEGSAVVTITGSLTSSSVLHVDSVGGTGGSGLTIGGTLGNNSGAHIVIGNATLVAPTTVKAAGLSNSGEIDLTGAPSVQATLNVTGAAPSTLTGVNKLTNDALLQYGSGAITTIGVGATLILTGGGARVALAATPGSNSALKTLATNNGTLGINSGALLTTTVALSNSGFLGIDNVGGGGANVTIGGMLSNSGTLDIGNSGTLTQTTSVTAAGLNNLSTGKLDIAGRAAPASLTLSATSTDAGTITIDSGGVLALGGHALTVASLGSLTLNGGTLSGGTLFGAGAIGSSKLSSSTLNSFTIASGATFAAGAGSTLTIEHVAVGGALTGGGSAGLVFGVAGTDTMINISGFPTIALADGGANTLSLAAGNFSGISPTTVSGVSGDFITVSDGDSGNTVNASSLPSPDAIIVYAGIGGDILTGGAGNDVFFAAGKTTMTGKGGINEFVFSAPGPANIITDFATSATNEVVFSDFGFSLGISGATSTPQALSSSLFVSNNTGTFSNTTQRFAYATGNGKLFFSADGSGSSSQLVSTLSGAPALSASHLFVVT